MVKVREPAFGWGETKKLSQLLNRCHLSQELGKAFDIIIDKIQKNGDDITGIQYCAEHYYLDFPKFAECVSTGGRKV